MKKILVTLLALFLVTPVFAITFTLTPGAYGSGKITVAYNLTAGEVLRGMALKVKVTSGNAVIDQTTDVVLQANTFNTFIDYAFSFPTGYDINVGHCLANPAAAGVLDLTTPKNEFVVSLSFLDTAGGQAGLTADSFFDIFFTTSTDSTFEIDIDPLRGGIVGDNLIASNLPLTVAIVEPPLFYNLTTAASAGGTVTTPGIGTYSFVAGTLVYPVAAPYANWFFWKWTGDIDDPVNPLPIIMDRDRSIKANFTFACQKFNFTKLVSGATDNAVTVADMNLMIGWVNANKTGTSFAVSNTNPAWLPNGPIYNLTKLQGAADNAVTVSDLNLFIGFVNSRKTGTSFAVNCATCGC